MVLLPLPRLLLLAPVLASLALGTISKISPIVSSYALPQGLSR
jgi:hypothetical protein